MGPSKWLTKFLAPHITPDSECDADGRNADGLLPLTGRCADLKMFIFSFNFKKVNYFLIQCFHKLQVLDIH
jgi:hypothetical protein